MAKRNLKQDDISRGEIDMLAAGLPVKLLGDVDLGEVIQQMAEQMIEGREEYQSLAAHNSRRYYYVRELEKKVQWLLGELESLTGPQPCQHTSEPRYDLKDGWVYVGGDTGRKFGDYPEGVNPSDFVRIITLGNRNGKDEGPAIKAEHYNWATDKNIGHHSLIVAYKIIK